MTINRIRSTIRALSAYHIPDSLGMVKLDAMENPYGWPDELKSRWLEIIRDVDINRYPDPQGQQLIDCIREVESIPDDSAVILGNGSDELIQIMAMATAKLDASILAPEPGFVMYAMIAKFSGMTYHGVPLRTDFSLDMEAMLLAIKTHNPALVFLAYPNNPSGNQWDRKAIEKIIRQTQGMVVIDEAYAPFASDTFMQDLSQYSNLLVMRTLSKFGLAGLRLGYLSGPPKLIEEFNKIRLPYNINTLTQKTALFCLQNKSVFDQQATKIRNERTLMLSQIDEIESLTAYRSDANFILFKTAQGKATAMFSALQARKILIKNLSANGGLLSDCLRVTIGTAQENRQFIKALKDVV